MPPRENHLRHPLLEVQTNQEADRKTGRARHLGIKGAELLLEKYPNDYMGQPVRKLSSVVHVAEARAEQVRLRHLMAWKVFVFYCE